MGEDPALEHKGRVVAITGGSSGIGLATAELVVRRGGRVAIMARDGDRLEAALVRLQASTAPGPVAIAEAGDATDAAAVDRFLERTAEELGPLTGLVAAAGSTSGFDLLDGEIDAWNEVLEANLGSALLAARGAARQLEVGGSIVLLGSMSARRVSRVSVPYGIAKGGVSVLSKALALELAGAGVRVNCVVPGYVDTPMTRGGFQVRARGDAALEENLAAAIEDSLPIGRLARPDEIAEVIAFVLSPRSSFVTGAELIVDGGELAGFGQLPPQPR